MKPLIRTLLAGCIAFSLAACNDGTVAVDGGTGGGTGKADSGSSGGGTGGGTGGGAGGGTGGGTGTTDAGPTLKYASINLARNEFDGGGLGSQIDYGAFENSPGQQAYLDARCTVVATSGSCRALNCGEARTDAGTVTARSLGTITVTGSSIDGGIDNFPTNMPTSFPDENNSLWNAAGQTLTVSVSGGDVPAFSKTIQAPDDYYLITPVCTFNSVTGYTECPAASRSSPFTLAWSNGTIGTFSVAITDIANSSTGGTVECDFPAGTHSGTIDASLMSHLSTGQLFFLYASGNEIDFTSGDYNVALKAGYAQILGGRIVIQ